MLFDGTGTAQADYDVSTSGFWTFYDNIVINHAGAQQYSIINSSDFTDIPYIGLTTKNYINSSHLTVGGYISGHAAVDFSTADGSIRALENAVLAWVPSTTDVLSAAADTGLSRLAAGVLGIGNGTAGDSSGALVATTYFWQNGLHSVSPAANQWEFLNNATLVLDYGVTMSGGWTITVSAAQALSLTSSNTTDTSLAIINTSVGGKEFLQYTTGSGNFEGAGHVGVYDQTDNRTMFDCYGSVFQVPADVVIGWNPNSAVANSSAPDTGLSRVAPVSSGPHGSFGKWDSRRRQRDHQSKDKSRSAERQ